MPPKRLATLLKDHRVEQGLTRVMLAQLLEDPALTGLLTEALVVALQRAGARPVTLTAKGIRY